MNAEQLVIIIATLKRLAEAQERIAAVLENETKIGGALWTHAQIAKRAGL